MRRLKQAFKLSSPSVFPSFLALGMLAMGVPQHMHAQSETVLYSFTGQEPGSTDGYFPRGYVLMDKNGDLYGATLYGGLNNGGTVFKVTPSGQETVLHRFNTVPGTDGLEANGGLVMDAQGNLYGTTRYGGKLSGITTCSPTPVSGCGTVYKLAPDGTETILHTFGGTLSGGVIDGVEPVAGLILDSQGNLYGTTSEGGSAPGASSCTNGCGTVFKVKPDGTETLLYSFTGLNGDNPDEGPLAMDGQGNLYGTTSRGGLTADCCGTVYKLAPNGTHTILYSFNHDAYDGRYPEEGVILGAGGTLYGTNASGGSMNAGTVFKLAPDGTEKILYNFNQGASYYEYSPQGVAMDRNGNLFGTALDYFRPGTVFELTPSGTFGVLHRFLPDDDLNDVQYPQPGVVMDAAREVYGTAWGGAYNSGGIFKISPPPTPTFSPAPGFYSQSQNVRISDAVSGSQIYYTTKYGDIPTVHSTPYTGPFVISKAGSVAAIAVAPGETFGTTAYAYYGFRVNEPAFNYGGGHYSAPIPLTISDSTPGAVIHYTTDGSTPTTTSPIYSGPITVSATETIRAIGLLAGYENSTVAGTSITIY